MTNVLVTGGCGFIGSNFINIMKERYPEIKFVNLDKLDYCSNLYNVNPGVSTFVKGDIRDNNLIGYLIKQYDFDAVFHFAAMSHVDNSFNDPKNFTLNNTYGTHVLLDKFREIKPNVEFIHFSTDEVYGESNTDVPFTEDVGVLKPTNPYSASKAAAEMIVQSYIDSYKMNIKTIRCNNVYGPNQYPEKLIPKFKLALRNGEMCTIHGFKSANIKRAFMHVNDVVDAVEIVWKRGNPGEIYNIASDDEISVLDVTKLIIKLNKNTEEYHRWITYVDDRPFNDSRYYISSDKLKSLGWSQKKTREDLINFLGQ
jgi:dTDP-glucose 4,6-dehydratase|tara:strand:- start:410 stop:1345 length:936 start_codon:yes stop_codon:yes gene_type:complete